MRLALFGFGSISGIMRGVCLHIVDEIIPASYELVFVHGFALRVFTEGISGLFLGFATARDQLDAGG